jgi:hypothetical protein
MERGDKQKQPLGKCSGERGAESWWEGNVGKASREGYPDWGIEEGGKKSESRPNGLRRVQWRREAMRGIRTTQSHTAGSLTLRRNVIKPHHTG